MSVVLLINQNFPENVCSFSHKVIKCNSTVLFGKLLPFSKVRVFAVHEQLEHFRSDTNHTIASF